jgi:hypothetical protein
MGPFLLLSLLLAVDDAGTVELSPEQQEAAIFSEPKLAGLVLSAAICWEQRHEKEALAAIRQEKEDAKIAGVVDLRLLRQLQDEVVARRKMVTVHRRRLLELKQRATKCGDRKVTWLQRCIQGEGTEEDACDEPLLRAVVNVFQMQLQRAEEEIGR